MSIEKKAEQLIDYLSARGKFNGIRFSQCYISKAVESDYQEGEYEKHIRDHALVYIDFEPPDHGIDLSEYEDYHFDEDKWYEDIQKFLSSKIPEAKVARTRCGGEWEIVRCTD